MTRGKAVGPDLVSVDMLKLCPEEIAPVLASIFNLSLSTGRLPLGWKQANIVPIFKKGNKMELNNYRPIALTSIISKLLESIVCESLRDHMNSYGLWTNSQNGFRPGLSCDTLLLNCTTEWLQTLDKTNSRVDIISLDYSRAFDSLCHQTLLKKLDLTYGISGHLLAWTKSFLCDRFQRVVFGGHSADWIPVESGIPQGSVLGPLLFSVYVNDLHLHVNSSIGQFADDTFIYHSVNSQDHETVKLQNDLDNLVSWSQKNALTLNIFKCKVLSLNRSRSRTKPTYYVQGQSLETVDNLKLLGVTLSYNMSWDMHVQNTVSKCNRLLGFIRSVAGHSSLEALLQLY